jgi:hypothetical protein
LQLSRPLEPDLFYLLVDKNYMMIKVYCDLKIHFV